MRARYRVHLGARGERADERRESGGVFHRCRPARERPLVHRRQRHCARPGTRHGHPLRRLWPTEGVSLDLFRHAAAARRDGILRRHHDAYLSWVWDIPISPHRTSVGFVLAADTLRERRRSGASPERILFEELSRHPRFRGLLDAQPTFDVERTSFQPYVSTRVCGANWMMIGEAASMPDPLTGNGVTSGVRHASHAVEAILDAGAGDQLGHAFNAHIEQAIYRHPIRQGLGLKTATYVYTFFAFFMNALHARFDPRGRVGMFIFSLLFGAARAWIGGWTLVARAALWLRPSLESAR